MNGGLQTHWSQP